MRIPLSVRPFLFLFLTVTALSCLSSAQNPPPWMPCSGANLVDQSFPTAGPEVTHWRLCWETIPGNGLLIHWAYFRKSPASNWVFLLWDARVSEIFVPYHKGSPRYYDVEYMFGLTPVGPQDCPAAVGGTVMAGNVCKEFHDRGLAWKSDTSVHRGEEVVLWSALAAAWYNYVIEWTFRDDGVVLGRVGATSHNAPLSPPSLSRGISTCTIPSGAWMSTWMVGPTIPYPWARIRRTCPARRLPIRDPCSTLREVPPGTHKLSLR